MSQLIRNPERKKWGRTPLLTDEQEKEIIGWIIDHFNNHDPRTPKELRMEILERYDVVVSKNWFRYLFEKHPNQLAIVTATPQEEQRLLVTKKTAKMHINNLIEFVQGIPTELILNLDEASSSDWEDRRPKKVVVPWSVRNRKVQYAVSRSAKKISICQAISMAGDALPPLIVMQRKTIDDEVIDEGYREGQDFEYHYQERSFVTTEIFKKYISNQIIPYIKQTRKQMNLQDSHAVLLMDNCPSHVNEEILKILADEKIRVVTFPPHTTNLFQPLDLVTFNIFKFEKSMTRSIYKKGSQIDIFYRNIFAMERATISSNNRQAFKRAGLQIQARVVPNIAIVREKYLNELIEISDLNDLDNINSKTEFGWINKKFFNE